jgi:phenylpyruvate tautomerase PptA (4-oxalocrotonate tautomerase family)
MPMCDIYIPEGALPTEVERALVNRVSDILVGHEMRRMVDDMADPAEVEASRERASSIAWMFVHRTETYVAGERTEVPYYKFEVTIPEGLIDDVFRDSIVSDLTRAVADAEGGKRRHVSQRAWVFTYQVPDGSWGGGGRMLCAKAGVPAADVRGKITSHRARSTIASQLYNAKEPMTLFELQA